MATIVTRSGKGSALTHTEMDANFNNLNGAKVETSAIGTAAASDVTTSSTDTTSGRLLKVGDFGVGGAHVIADANAVAYSGLFRVNNSSLNIPVATWGSLYCTGDGLGGIVSQIYIQSNNGDMWVRGRQSDSWSDWQEVYHTGNEQQIGVNQTWQDVAASRSVGVAYTNSTGKPIMVSYTSYFHGSIFINGVEIAKSSTGSYYTSYTFIVPNGATYKITDELMGIHWKELR